ncbi:hypothetical protein AB0442_27610 [Kitasatospora sp. NPDC085895]|uniref:hypothetical protein n=1 Tax=Kitasatospora sp. NPDC085895 TaxID=3155057 RepID=UPI00344F9CE6
MTTSGMTSGGPKAPGHARSGLKHWALVAAGCGAVVAGALAADPAQGTPTPVRPTAEPVPAAAAPDPGKAELPLDCGPFGVSVALRASATVDGVPSTVVAAHCAAGNGTPPDGVYLLTNGPDGRPKVAETLLDPVKDGLTVTALTIRSDGAIRGHAQGWSSDDVPRCCPDRAVDLSWTRQGEDWVRAQSAVPAGQV